MSSTCPVCGSTRLVLVIKKQRRGFCTSCGSRWVEEGGKQRDVKPGMVSPSHPSLGSRKSDRPQ